MQHRKIFHNVERFSFGILTLFYQFFCRKFFEEVLTSSNLDIKMSIFLFTPHRMHI